jgi:hypothetical protein
MDSTQNISYNESQLWVLLFLKYFILFVNVAAKRILKKHIIRPVSSKWKLTTSNERKWVLLAFLNYFLHIIIVQI